MTGFRGTVSVEGSLIKVNNNNNSSCDFDHIEFKNCSIFPFSQSIAHWVGLARLWTFVPQTVTQKAKKRKEISPVSHALCIRNMEILNYFFFSLDRCCLSYTLYIRYKISVAFDISQFSCRQTKFNISFRWMKEFLS